MQSFRRSLVNSAVAIFFVFTVKSFAAEQRIVTLAPAIAETVAQILGTEAASRQIVGVSEYTDFPVELKAKPSIGPYFKPNLEAILALKPDLVIATRDGNPKEIVDQLRKWKIPVLEIQSQSIQEMMDSEIRVGQALGHKDVAEKQVSQMKSEMSRIKKNAQIRDQNLNKKQKVMFQLDQDPLVVAGGRSFLSEILTLMGAENIYRDDPSAYPKVSVESVFQKNPDWILCIAFSSVDQQRFEGMKKKWERFSQLEAIKKKQVVVFHSDALVRPGPRLMEGVRQLEKQIYGMSK